MGDLGQALHRHGDTCGHANRAIGIIRAATSALVEEVAHHVGIMVLFRIQILELYKAAAGATVTEAFPIHQGIGPQAAFPSKMAVPPSPCLCRIRAAGIPRLETLGTQ